MSRVKKRYWGSVVIWLVIDGILLTGLLLLIPKLYSIAFGLGTALSLLMGFSQTGINDTNVVEFAPFACASLSEEEQKIVLAYIMGLL